jgi:hypothetical protein
MDLKNIETRLKNGLFVSDAERAYFIKGNIEGLCAFMVENNPGSVNFTLRKLGYSHLGFEPDKTAIVRQLQIFVDRKNTEDLDEVIKNFKVDESNISPSLLSELKKQFSI